MSELGDQLSEAWVEWDRAPGAEYTTRIKLMLMSQMADTLGITSLEFHRGVVELIHQGYTSREAINLLERAYG